MSAIRRGMAGAMALLMAVTLAPGAARASVPHTPGHKRWSPFLLPVTKSVPGHPATTNKAIRPSMPATRPAHRVFWPAARTVALSAAGTTTVPGTGLSLTLSTASDLAASPVTASLASHAAAVAAGVDGVIVGLSAPAASASVRVSLDSSVLAGTYGAGWAAAAHLVSMPGCALTTPSIPSCRVRTPLAAGSALRVSSTVIAATAGPSGADGSYTATSLKGSDSWTAGGNAGSFSYTFPIDTPPALNGAAPRVALSYDSGGVDGETVNANSQASWIGDGWSYTPGFIERSFQSCSAAGKNTADLCWKVDNATLSGGAHAGPLVHNDSDNSWRMAYDDGTTVEEKFDATVAAPGTSDRSYWMITTPDGTKYFYGAGHLPASLGGTGVDPGTNSDYTEPVYAIAPGQECYSTAGFASSWCQQDYRWNLDYVVDPHGNTIVYTYAAEPSGYYTRAFNGTSGTITPYVRAGNPQSIAYGWRTADVASGTASPAAKVVFTSVERCMGDPGGCGYADLNSTTAGYWRDTPYYLNCPSSGTCAQYSPTYWSTRMLDTITTYVNVSGTPREVDSYKLNHSWPEPGDAQQASLWLDSVQRTAYDGGTTGLASPAVTFTGTQMANRVPGRTVNGQTLPPMIHYRVTTIADELGAKITVTYSSPTCSQSAPTILPSSPDSNTMLCYPVQWTPSGGSRITDWFNKYLVKTVAVTDSVTATTSPAQVTNYQYVGNPAWHDNDSEFVPDADRTWDQWRGYQQVIKTTGASPDPITQVQTTYLRGMDGDLTAAGGTRSVSVTDSQGGSYRDADPLDGTVIETQKYSAADGTVVSDEIDTPYVSAPVASHARPAPLPPQVSVRTDTSKSVVRDLVTGGGWRTHEIDYGYDPAHGNRRISVDDKGDGSASAPETCTLTKYASSTVNPQLMTYPSEVLTVAGGCATTPGTTTTVSDAITLYDGNTTAGLLDNSAYAGGVPVTDATGQQVVASYSGGTPSYLTTATSTFDVYGRVLTATDPNADPLHPTRTTYTPTTGALPTQVVVVNPKGFTTTTVEDPLRGRPTEIRDLNGRVTDLTYDQLGRVTQVWLPGRAMSASPSKKFAYLVSGGSGPSWVLTQVLLENGQYTSSYSILDGLGQTRQVQSNSPTTPSGRLITDTYYDSHGWAVKSHALYFNGDSAPSATLQITDDSAVPASSTTAYDGQGRTVATTTFQFATPQATTTTAYPGADRVDVTPPAPIAPTSTFTDVRGHTTATWRYTGGMVTGTAADADVLSYYFDAAGRTSKIVDPHGDTWTYQYDLRGDKTLAHDPDAGDTVMTYDNDARLTSTKDANGTYNTYTYDTLGRKLTQYTGSATPGAGTEVAAWTYDTGIASAKGQLVSSTAYHNGLAYTEAVTGFTPTMAGGAYTSTGSKVTIPAGDGNDGISGTYTTSQTFTTNIGLPYTTTLPGAAGQPAENIQSAYDDAGLLVSIGSSTSGVSNVDYDRLGRPIRTTLGTEPDQASVTDDYDDGTGRLLTRTFNEESAPVSLDTINTYYDIAGQITATADLRGDGGTDLQCFAYDYAGRLATAWTDTGTVTPAGPQYIANTGSCAHGAPTAASAAAQIGGPTPYWETYTYNSDGDRAADTIHDVTGVTAHDVTHTYHYPAASNLLQSTTTTGPSGTTTDNYGYYANGETNTRTRAAGGNQSFGYDTTGHVATATTASGAASYVRDAGGALLVQHDPGENVLYLAGEEIHYNKSTLATDIVRTIAGPAGAKAIENSTGAVTYAFADPHNSVTLTVDAHTQAVTRRAFDPYGNPRGGQPSYANGTWPDEHTYLDKPTDASTGLTLIGPRQYDPAQGRFLEPDPVLETGDLDQIGGYTYSADDPANTSDPTGLRTEGQYYAPSEDPGTTPIHYCDGCQADHHTCISSQEDCRWTSRTTTTTKVGGGSITQTVTSVMHSPFAVDGGWETDTDIAMQTQYTGVPCLSDGTCEPDVDHPGQLVPVDHAFDFLFPGGQKFNSWPAGWSGAHCIHVGPGGTCSQSTVKQYIEPSDGGGYSSDAGVGATLCFIFCVGVNQSRDGSTHLVVGLGLLFGVSAGPYVSQGEGHDTIQVNAGPISISGSGGETGGASIGPSIGETFGIGFMHSF